ncbi:MULTISPECIES: hypothetical protein [Psychrobacter]|uniref:hypothetical protein n=1 Tax=Psychrobacter TaxID=497 RepID=UPI000C32B30B|nr:MULTISPECIES: hypothetical protein [Psychrobacter]PKG34491.1 hypothetical protein CXF65_13145 [Psychrobacter sp. Sarcosine-3u-12]
MTTFKKLAIVLCLTPLFIACSDAPSATVVEGLIQDQYEQADSLMDDAVAQAGDNEMAQAMGGMFSGMMPKLESVENVNCDSIEGDNTFMCTADITQTIAGNSRTDKGSFKVYQVNDEWVLGR